MEVEVVGPMFPDDSNELTPSLLEVASTMFKASREGAAPRTSAGPLCLPDVKKPEWYCVVL